MKRLSAAALLAALLCGCATKEMRSTPFYEGADSSFTGRIEDRVNLWPLAYWREPVFSAVGSMLSFGDDHIALRPLYSQYRQDGRDGPYDEFNLVWPLFQADFAGGDYRVFPLFWGEDYFAAFPLALLKSDTTVVLPLVMNGSGSDGAFFPFVFWTHERGERAFTLFPLYSYSKTPERMRLWGACGLFGNYRPDTGEYAHWALPFYYANRRGLFSVPWSRTESFDGDVVEAYLCGLGGRTLAGGKRRSSWAAPFYYQDEERLITPLFGKSAASDWVMPLYYRDGDSLFTLPYASWGNRDTGTSGFLSAPLLTWATWSTNSCRSSWGTLGGLVGAKSNATGERRSHWAFPLYSSDAGRSFLSLPYGWTGGGTSRTNTWWATPLVGTRAGAETGWWAFPFFDRRKDSHYGRFAALPDESALPVDFDIEKPFSASEESRCLLLSEVADYAFGRRGWGSETNRYEVTRGRDVGNLLLYHQSDRRNAKYEVGNRRKSSDCEICEVSLLLWLYERNSRRDLMSGECTSRHRVLWKLWDWQRKDDDVRLDAFPGFTYDSKSDGYMKASLLWRFFRYENDPCKGVEADFLFLPVWR